MLKGFEGYTSFEQLLALPYKKGGRSPDGVDCYGLAMVAANIAGYELPEFDYDCLATLRQYFPLRRVSKPHKGCFVEFVPNKDGVPHCGVYINGRDVIHASENHGVRIDRADWLKVEAVYEITKTKD